MSEADKEKIKKKILSNPDEAQKVGETLILVLEQTTDLDKPQMLATLFLCYVEGIINSKELRRMTTAINAAFADDLLEFLDAKAIPTECSEPWIEGLVAAGLARTKPGASWARSGQIFYTSTVLGERLRTAHAHRSLCERSNTGAP